MAQTDTNSVHNGATLEGANDGRLVENVLFFCRTLRAAGMPVGPERVLQAIDAVRTVGLSRRDDFYWALHAVLVNRRDQQEIFDQAFHVFWRNPRVLNQIMSLLLPSIQIGAKDRPPDALELSPRLSEALGKNSSDDEESSDTEEETRLDAAFTWSDREVLNTMDFEKMTNQEMADAKKAIEAMRLPILDVPTRRFRPDSRGRRADLRATFRAALRTGGTSIPLRWKRHRRRHPPLVVLCDISGSMGRYSRMLLHFLHAITNDRDRVHCFLFGTRLTNVTRSLRNRDVDLAIERVSDQVFDWSGGTRIGSCLHDFNAHWSRRVLGQGAVVLLITDGLDREMSGHLEQEMERLHKSCRRLIWLNPLLRYDRYEPKTAGARAILPHVDEFRSAHSLASLTELSEALSRPQLRRKDEQRAWMEMTA